MKFHDSWGWSTAVKPRALPIILLVECSALNVSFAQQGPVAFIGPDPISPTNTLVYTVNPDGSERRSIPVALVVLHSAKWSRDGQLIAAGGALPASPKLNVFAFDRAGGNLRQVTDINISDFEVFYMFPAFSPDSGQVALVAYSRRVSTGSQFLAVLVNSVDGVPGPTVLVDTLDGNLFEGFGIDWSPVANLLAVPIATVELCLGTFVPVTEIWSVPPEQGAFARGLGRPISRHCTTLPILVDDVSPAFSPDGTRIAFVRRITLGRDISTSIRVINVDGTGEQEIAFFDSELSWSVSWSAGGNQLVFDRGRVQDGIPLVGSLGLWTINLDRSGLAQLTDPTAYAPSWSWAGFAPLSSDALLAEQ